MFDGREPSMIVIDDHMSDVNELIIYRYIYENWPSQEHQRVAFDSALVRQEQVCQDDKPECTLPRVVQESERCGAVCDVCTTDVSELLAICSRSVPGRHEGSVRVPACGSETGPGRSLSTENKHFSG